MNDALVTIEGLTKRFAASEPPAIDGLTTAIRAGQVTGLVGPDGAGKTTLMRLVAALLTPSEGKVTVCGFDAATQADDIHDTIGYMPQRFGLYEDLSVIENLDLVLEMGDRLLAYEIKKRDRGHYVLFTMDFDPQKVVPAERMFKLNQNLLKYLFVRAEA